uniref:TrkA family potassium uptake protein n=1 Tax=candidate division WOR-3 bacterium TaxID=2052148 RepID=A0A7C2K605_UNCW3
MNILVIGAGRFGRSLAEVFMRENHTVVLVDKDENKIKGMEDMVSQAVILDSTDESALAQLNLEDFDYVFLCISEISASILTAQILQDRKIKNVYAKASNDVHAKILSRLGVSKIVQPEKQSAERLAMSIMMGTVELADLLKKKNIMISTVDVPRNFQKKSLSELEIRKKFGLYVIAVERNEPVIVEEGSKPEDGSKIGVSSKTVTYVLPDGGFEIERTDRLIVIGTRENIEKFVNYVSKEAE